MLSLNDNRPGRFLVSSVQIETLATQLRQADILVFEYKFVPFSGCRVVAYHPHVSTLSLSLTHFPFAL